MSGKVKSILISLESHNLDDYSIDSKPVSLRDADNKSSKIVDLHAQLASPFVKRKNKSSDLNLIICKAVNGTERQQVPTSPKSPSP